MALKVVILCGGTGSRLWPKSRKSLPKQFLPIINKKSLLDLTLERTLCIKDRLETIIICNEIHRFLVKNALQKYGICAKLILEPEGKNTTAAIYLAAKISSGTDNLLIMPSDHLIDDNSEFQKNMNDIENSTSFEEWITLGVKPFYPSDSYGYIKTKKTNTKLLKVTKFIEKPSHKNAAKFLNDPNIYWNSGIFLGKSNMIIQSIKKHAPSIAYECDKVFKNILFSKDKKEISFPAKMFSKIPSQSIDFAIMENAKNIKLFPFLCKWDDLGTWDSIDKISSNLDKDDNVIEIDSEDNLIKTNNRIIATIGLRGFIIVDSDNATLIAKKNHSEKVKEIVNILRKRHKNQAEHHVFEDKPWGKFEVLLDNTSCKVKKLIIAPYKRLSLQFHNFRSEHWLIVKGKAFIHLNGKIITANPGESIDIPIKTNHYVENKNSEDLIIIETQLGSYFGEDDIVRIDDPYDR